MIWGHGIIVVGRPAQEISNCLWLSPIPVSQSFSELLLHISSMIWNQRLKFDGNNSTPTLLSLLTCYQKLSKNIAEKDKILSSGSNIVIRIKCCHQDQILSSGSDIERKLVIVQGFSESNLSAPFLPRCTIPDKLDTILIQFWYNSDTISPFQFLIQFWYKAVRPFE